MAPVSKNASPRDLLNGAILQVGRFSTFFVSARVIWVAMSPVRPPQESFSLPLDLTVC